MTHYFVKPGKEAVEQTNVLPETSVYFQSGCFMLVCQVSDFATHLKILSLHIVSYFLHITVMVQSLQTYKLDNEGLSDRALSI